jgi:cytochrome c
MRVKPSTPSAAAVLLLSGMLALAACGSGGSDTSADLVTDADPDRAPAAMLTHGCGSCHSIPGIQSVENGVGPDLHELGDRRYLAGQVPNRPEELVRWIQHPQEVEPGTAMPDMGVTEQEARDIAAYLYDH